MAKTLKNSQAPLIQITHLNKYFQLGDQQLHVLKDISLHINEGEFVSIMGPSGSGKSTLINVLGFLDHDFKGDYQFQGQPIELRSDHEISALRNKEVGFVFQDFNLIDTMTVAENVALPLLYSGKSAKQAKKPVEEMLSHMGLQSKLQNRPYELSGGQRQRVAIARALINAPKFLIADEPTGALDTKTSAVIMEILERLNKEDGVTVVMVTHDPTLQRFANRHLVIVDGRVEEKDQAEAERLSAQYKNEQFLKEQEDEADETPRTP